MSTPPTATQPLTTVDGATPSSETPPRTVPTQALPDGDIDWDPVVKRRAPASIVVPDDPTALYDLDGYHVAGRDLAYILDGCEAYLSTHACQRLRTPDKTRDSQAYREVATAKTALSPTGKVGYTHDRATAMRTLFEQAVDSGRALRLVACDHEPAMVHDDETGFLVRPAPVPEQAPMGAPPAAHDLPGRNLTIVEADRSILPGITRLCDAVEDYFDEHIEAYDAVGAGDHRFWTATGRRLRFDGTSCRLACRGVTSSRDLLGETTLVVGNGHAHFTDISAAALPADVGDRYPAGAADSPSVVIAQRPTFDDPTDPMTDATVPRLYITSYVLSRQPEADGIRFRLRPRHDLIKRFPDSPAATC
jgi:hypothetical protein